MGATTPKLAIPYVGANDLLNAYPAADKAQADRLEALFTTKTTSATDWVTAAAGWSMISSRIDVFGKMALFNFGVTRTGAALPVPADGNIGTQVMGTYNTTTWSLQTLGPCSTTDGRLASLALYSNGNVSLTACVPGTSIATSESLYFAGLMFLN